MRTDKTRGKSDLKSNSNRSFKYKLIISSVILFILSRGLQYALHIDLTRKALCRNECF